MKNNKKHIKRKELTEVLKKHPPVVFLKLLKDNLVPKDERKVIESLI